MKLTQVCCWPSDDDPANDPQRYKWGVVDYDDVMNGFAPLEQLKARYDLDAPGSRLGSDCRPDTHVFRCAQTLQGMCQA